MVWDILLSLHSLTNVFQFSDTHFTRMHNVTQLNHLKLTVEDDCTPVSLQPPDTNVTEPLGDAEKQEAAIMMALETNLQQLHGAIMTMWSKIFQECFQHILVQLETQY